jgi:hypothetical protein
MEMIVFFVLMVALLVFIIWDGRQPVKAVSREQLSKGFIPGSHAKWIGFLGLAFACFCLAVNEYITPSAPPFTGKGSTLMALVYNTFGMYGTLFLWIGIGVVSVSASYKSYRSDS